MASGHFVEVAKSEFEYFAPQAIQNSVVRAFKREYTPVSALQHGSPIQFFIPGSDMLYLDLSKSYLYVRAKIQTSANANPADDAQVGPINNVLHSMFSNIEVELGGKPLSDSNPYNPYRAYFEVLLTYDQDAQDSQLQAALWRKDTAGQLSNFASNDTAPNLGLRDRASYFARGSEVEMLGRIHSDLFHQEHAIPANIALKVRLIPSLDKFVLVTPAPTGTNPQENYNLLITDARLYIHTLEVSPSLALAHSQMLQKSNMHFPMRRVTMKHISIPTGQTTVNADNIYIGEQPNRIVMALVNDAAMSGGYQQNPFNFQHFDVNYLALYVNGEMIPSRPYQPNFNNGRYIREYSQIFEGMGTLFANKGISINRNEYARGFTIFIFDLTPDQNCQACLSAPKSGAVRLEIKFGTATPSTVNCLLYAEYDSWFEIDKYRNIITSY